MVFNPSSMDRLFHALCGCWQAGAFLVVSVGAWYLLKKRHEAFAKASMRVGLAVGLVASLLQLVSGHDSAKGVAINQPAKLAAFEGLYETTTNAPLVLFGWVDEKNQRVVGPSIPGLLSYLTHGDAGKPVTGLNEFKPEDRPPVQRVFQFYHLMVGIGFGMIGLALFGAYFCWRKVLFEKRWMLWLLVFSVLGPQLANQAGWFAAEMGRQPWIVHGLMRTSAGLSAVVTANAVLGSLVLFTFIYVLLFAVFVYLLNDKIQHGAGGGGFETHGNWPRPSEVTAHELRRPGAQHRLVSAHWRVVHGLRDARWLRPWRRGASSVHREDEERRIMLNAIGPVWDGNEVWLVTGGGALFAAFPNVYATVFSGFYFAFVLLLVALIFRAVAIEFRSKQPMGWWRQMWTWASQSGACSQVSSSAWRWATLRAACRLTTAGNSLAPSGRCCGPTRFCSGSPRYRSS